MMFPLARDLAADGIPVAVTCRVLGFSRQAFYKWNTDPVSRRDWDDAHLINAALDIHAGDPEFGYRFIADELPSRGISPAKTASTGCVRSSGSSRCSPRSEDFIAAPGHRSMTTSSGGSSAPSSPTGCG